MKIYLMGKFFKILFGEVIIDLWFKQNEKIRFIAVGVVNTGFSYSIFAFLIFIRLHYFLAVLLATILGVLFNFKTIGKLVFGHNDNSRLIHFIMIYVVIYILNVSGLWFFEQLGFFNKYIAGFILLFPLAVISFLLNKQFVFACNSNTK